MKTLGNFKIYLIAWDWSANRFHIMPVDMFDYNCESWMVNIDQTGTFLASNVRDARRKFIDYVKLTIEETTITYGF